jgi:3-methylcrotonyl-CoA carboxylase alpha subunit
MLALAAAAVDELARARPGDDAGSPWAATDAWWPNSARHAVAFAFADGDATAEVRLSGPLHALSVEVDGKRTTLRAERRGERWRLDTGDEQVDATVVRHGEERHVLAQGLRRRLRYVDPLAHAGEEAPHGGHLTAPMSGTVVAVPAKVGDRVERGAALVVLEAMKMEHTIAAPAAGVVTAVHFAVGDRVPEGADLVDLEDSGTAP